MLNKNSFKEGIAGIFSEKLTKKCIKNAKKYCTSMEYKPTMALCQNDMDFSEVASETTAGTLTICLPNLVLYCMQNSLPIFRSKSPFSPMRSNLYGSDIRGGIVNLACTTLLVLIGGTRNKMVQWL